VLGYIDCDTHVIESSSAWGYLSPDEEKFRPKEKQTDGKQMEWRNLKNFWELHTGQLIIRGLSLEDVPGQPSARVRRLEDVPGRLKWMDDLGVDAQVVISSFFLAAIFTDADAQVALSRSYNCWLADCYHQSGGRLRWSLVAPLLDMDVALEELRVGAANGAVSVLMRPLECERLLTDPYFFPLYEEAQEQGLAIGIHIGNSHSPVYSIPEAVMFSVVPMTAAFVNIFSSDFAERFPDLRFGFLEAGSEWLPYALREISRGADVAWRRNLELKDTPLSGTNLFIDCTFDEDLNYVMRFSGTDNLVLGSDFGHSDFGTDVGAHELILKRSDLDASVVNKITEMNGRRLYGL